MTGMATIGFDIAERNSHGHDIDREERPVIRWKQRRNQVRDNRL